MTTIFKRPRPAPRSGADGAVTHALVIGCGRFTPDGDGELGARPQAVAGARLMAQCLITNADALAAPLVSVECLLSDPANAPGADQLGLGSYAYDPRSDDRIVAAVLPNVLEALRRWKTRCEAGDHLIFYMSSHGVVERNKDRLGLLEDFLIDPTNPYQQCLNFTVTANGLSTVAPGPAWAFWDCCQTIWEPMLALSEPVRGELVVNPGSQKRFQLPGDTLALAPLIGKPAWAPLEGAPDFTRALVRGLQGACIEAKSDLGWMVTAESLERTLDQVANAALDCRDLKVERVGMYSSRRVLLRPGAPMIPVAVRTKHAPDMVKATCVTAERDDGVMCARGPEQKDLETWRFDVEPGPNIYIVRAILPDGRSTYKDGRFAAQPSAQIVELRS